MAQAFSCRPLTEDARFQCQVSPCEFCGTQSGTGTGSSPSISVFPCQCHFLCFYQKDKGRNLGIFKKVMVFQKSESIR
jgi:hypothetical protein